MIQIHTVGNIRTYLVPRAVADIANDIFTADANPVFQLARSMTADDLLTVEQIALNVSHDAAMDFARQRMRPSR